MKAIITVIGALLTLTTAALAEHKPVKFKGISCTGTQEVNGVKPVLIIKDISKKTATLILNMDGGIPDIRNSSLDKVVENGKLIVGYVSHKSAVTPTKPNFAVYTNGSTPQDTTRATLTFENNDSEIQMTCRDGMVPSEE